MAVIALADCLALAAVLARHATLALGTLPLEGLAVFTVPARQNLSEI